MMWQVLEHDLLAVFHKMYGRLPYYNEQGKNFSIDDIRYFRRSRLQAIIQQLS